MSSDITRPLLFEIAWEVANKVGGIYTVIKSKAPVTCKEYAERYCLIGPLSPKSAALEVEECEPPTPCLALTIAKIREAGIHIVFGKWLIPGSPFVLLFDISSAFNRLGEWKTDLWNVAGVPSPDNDTEMNDSVIFGYLISWFFGEFLATQENSESRPKSDLEASLPIVLPKPVVIAHFHEWLAGVALILIRKRAINVATIFTTHATLLGRYLCAGDVDFYNNLKFFDVDTEAGKRGIYHRYCVERAAAHCADVFTTVSKITAYEAEWLLKRQPDGVLPNGLNVIKFQAIHEFQNLHAKSKEAIHEFVRGHFFGHYHFDLDNTLYFFTAGRYEYRNKGVDMFIESLARLNGRLKEAKSNINVVAFIIMPAKNHSFTVEALRSQAEMKQLRQTVNQIQHSIGQRIFEAASKSEIPKNSDLLSEEDTVLLKGRILASRRRELPPIVTHNMVDDANDQILNGLRRCHLFNYKDDKVKVVFHPEFLNANSPLMSIDYDDFLRGCHLGVFPSYYEPWGYTPAECTVMGIPSITTNLSGFGCFMQEVINYPSDYGIYITDRRSKSVEDSLNQLTDYMFDFCVKTRRQRINQRNRCERLSDVLDWKRMGLEYVKARWVAIRRKFPDLAAQYDEVHFEDSDDGLSADFASGYDSDNHNTASREDLSRLGKRQKVPRPMSIPGSPTRVDEEFLDNVPVAHLFDDSEKGKVNKAVMMDELRAMNAKNASPEYLKEHEGVGGEDV